MKRYALLAATVATLCFGMAQTSQAQFRIDLGNGVQFDTYRGVRVNPQTNRNYDPYRRVVHRADIHDDHHDDHAGDHHVLRYHDQHHRGYYFERNGHYYYNDGRGNSVLVRSGSFSHVDDLAIRLEQLTSELCLDMHYNYRHNPGFKETYREVYQLYELAKYIHAEEHHGHHEEIARKLTGMDDLFHHVQEDIRGWHRHHHRQIGSLGIISKTDRIESTIHHLMNDVGARFEVAPEEPPLPAGGGRELPPRP
jgi:hypothetical protein